MCQLQIFKRIKVCSCVLSENKFTDEVPELMDIMEQGEKVKLLRVIAKL